MNQKRVKFSVRVKEEGEAGKNKWDTEKWTKTGFRQGNEKGKE